MGHYAKKITVGVSFWFNVTRLLRFAYALSVSYDYQDKQ